MQIKCMLWVKVLCMIVEVFPLYVVITVGVITHNYYTYCTEHVP